MVEKSGPDGAGGSPHEEATILGSLDVHRPGEAATTDRPAGFVDLAEFRRALVDIGLIDQAGLDAIAVAVPESQGVLGLARTLQHAGRLTAYQAAAIRHGKSRGLLIGHFLILDKLGAGGKGTAFKARDRKLGRVVALKILPPSFARDRTAVQRFRREVEAAGRLKHPNIVAVLDADEDRGVFFLVTEYVEGSDLDRVVRQRGPLTLDQAIEFVIQAARGLEAAHGQGIVHRDIKPSKLMLDSSGMVRVLDPGLRQWTDRGVDSGAVDVRAPEPAEDSRPADHRADIYSLGCTLYFLFTGREPFVGETALERLKAHGEQPAPMLRALRPDVPTALEEAYRRMMARRPEDRPGSMTEVIAMLEGCRASVVAIPDERGRKTEKGAATARPGRDETALARRDDAGSPRPGAGRDPEDAVMGVRSEVPAVAPMFPMIRQGRTPGAEAVRRPGTLRARFPHHVGWPAIVAGLATIVLLGGILVRFGAFPALDRSTAGPAMRIADAGKAHPSHAEIDRKSESAMPVPTPSPQVERRIFDGRSAKGWMLTNARPLPPRHVQPDGLNPHGTGSYLVVHEQKQADFILDFDYKLSKGCDSGVFLRVGDLEDPVNTGIEVALVDTTGTTVRDSGAIAGRVPPVKNVQKPAGEWNHMTITARGPVIAVALNGTDVSRIDLGESGELARRPRSGYLGFQNLVGDCWFREITLKTGGSLSARSVAGRTSDGVPE